MRAPILLLIVSTWNFVAAIFPPGILNQSHVVQTNTGSSISNDDSTGITKHPKGFKPNLLATKQLNAQELNAELLNILSPGEYIRMVLLDASMPYNAEDINDWLWGVYDSASVRSPDRDTVAVNNTLEHIKTLVENTNIEETTSGAGQEVQSLVGLPSSNVMDVESTGPDPALKDMKEEVMKELKDTMTRKLNDLILVNVPKMSPEECELDSSIEEIRRLEDILEWFVNKLKSYMLQVVFDFREFERMGEELDHIIEDIDTSVLKIASCNNQLMDQLMHTKYMFSTMAGSIELLRYYESEKTPVHTLIYLVIDLNVMLLALLSSQGIPDSSLDGYRDKVYRANTYLNIWDKQFEDFRGIPFGKKMMFRRHFYAAEKTAKLLYLFVNEQK